jgi:tRNA modification GTPase
LSARTGEGLEALRETLLQWAGWLPSGEGVFIARARHVQALTEASTHIDIGRRLLGEASPALELLAEELRLAHQALGMITGSFTADDLLGRIFARFCIGK